MAMIGVEKLTKVQEEQVKVLVREEFKRLLESYYSEQEVADKESPPAPVEAEVVVPTGPVAYSDAETFFDDEVGPAAKDEAPETVD